MGVSKNIISTQARVRFKNVFVYQFFGICIENHKKGMYLYLIIIIFIKCNIQICSKHCTIKYKAIYYVLKTYIKNDKYNCKINFQIKIVGTLNYSY